jgi:segregation and condensation protein B
MSLKAKLEAVIYAAEEPVTLTQLAALFAGDALEWKAAQQAAAAELAAEVAGENSAQPLPLLAEGLEYLGLADSTEASADDADVSAPSEVLAAIEPEPPLATPSAEAEQGPADPADIAADNASGTGSPLDTEAEAKRLSRLRDREIKGVLKHLLDELIADYASDGRGVEIREIAGGYRMATKPECHDAVRLFVKSLKPPMRLSLPALETLAVVAYKQPVTSPEVSEIRGVESGGVLGSLLARKLIATAGRKQVIGRPILYKTTKEFLLRFGLKDVAELPSMEEFEKIAAAEIEELEPEAVAADAAQSEAEEEIEAATALSANQNPDDALAPESGAPVATGSLAATDASASSNHQESALGTPVETAGSEAALETSAVNDVLPAQPYEETEAVPHAEKEQEER